jgi:hypothetical protein
MSTDSQSPPTTLLETDVALREFNPQYARPKLGQFGYLHADIDGNRGFVEHLRNLLVHCVNA